MLYLALSNGNCMCVSYRHNLSTKVSKFQHPIKTRSVLKLYPDMKFKDKLQGIFLWHNSHNNNI